MKTRGLSRKGRKGKEDARKRDDTRKREREKKTEGRRKEVSRMFRPQNLRKDAFLHRCSDEKEEKR
jgi:hypothetical protein